MASLAEHANLLAKRDSRIAFTEQELGWKPKYPKLEDIIATARAWHKKYPNGYAD